MPEPQALTETDEAVLAAVEAGLVTVGRLIEEARFKAALGEAIALATSANQYLNDQAPWNVMRDDRDRAGTILYVALRCIDNLKTMLTPFLPFSCQALHELLGYDGYVAGPLTFAHVTEDDGSAHEVLTGDYASWSGRWVPSGLPPGQAIPEPRPLFEKLDPDAVVAEELARMERSAAAA